MKPKRRLAIRFENYFRSLLELPPPLINVKILNREFRVREQTIRETPDYDDGWLFACATHAYRIFDIGANIGQSALLELIPDQVEHLLLVEPNTMALAMAAENLIINQLVDRVNFESAFLSDISGSELEFYTIQFGAAGSMFSSHAQTAKKLNKHFRVKTKTIDELVKKYGIPDFIKIDIEGAESFALRGAINCLRNHKTRLLVEMHSNAELPMEENTSRVLEICSQVGYKAWYLSRHRELIDPNDLSDRGRCHVLLQPLEWEWPANIIGIKQGACLDQSLYDFITAKNHA